MEQAYKKGMKRLVSLLACLTVGCGGVSTMGPSVVAAPQVSTPPPFPASIDPSYVRQLATIDLDGFPKRWRGGPFHHCHPAEIPASLVDETAARMTALTGIPRTETGPCNVTWRIDPSIDAALSAYTWLGSEGNAIVSATMTFKGAFQLRNAGHESGHVLGLLHSPRPDDCMYGGAQRTTPDFTPDERAVLAWIYGR